MEATISVAMATYNGAAFLDAQLGSIAEQTLLPFELVVVDDGSDDLTLAIANRFAATAPFPVRIHRNASNIGYRANFLRAASLCSGTLIAFCDQDDVWHPDKLARTAAVMEDATTMLVFHNAILIDGDGREIGFLDPIDARPECPLPAITGPWPLAMGLTQLFRASLLDHIASWSGSVSHFIPGAPMGHDRWTMLVASALGSIAYLPDRLTFYRQHRKNLFGAPAVHRRRAFKSRLANMRQEHRAISLLRNAAANRITILSAIARAVNKPPHGTGNLQIAYGLLERRLEKRHLLHTSPQFRQRLSVFYRLLADRAYSRRDPWRFPLRALAKDLLVALPLGPANDDGRARDD